ncbi:MAG TPA: 2-oxo acid dehydrogenase subunit E2 [Rhodocyclaceae bacterium]|nr:2-oxo acid dehydrogenase subunit E2 [Rhodocyclaceae bacterium]
MAKEFRLKDPGEGIHEAEILEIHVATGDHVSDGDDLITVETDKAAVDIPAPFSGTIEEIRVEQGDVATVGDVIITYREDGARGAEADEEAGEEGEKKADAEAKAGSRGEDEAAEKDEAAGKDKAGGKDEAAEKDEGGSAQAAHAGKARMRDRGGAAKAEGDDREAEEGGDEGERKASDKDESERKPASKDESEQKASDKADRKRKAESEAEDAAGRPVPASPATRRLARELGVSLRELSPSGPEGRVTAEDVRAAAGGGRGTAAAPALPDFSRWGEIERVRMRSIRRATARQMSLAWSQIPHVMNMDVADVTELERFRRSHKAAAGWRGGKLTLTVLLLKAVAALLKDFPRLNASLDTESGEIVLKRYYHIGVAVQSERGLLVPVVRDVDRKSVAEVAAELAELAERARAGELGREAMQGGSFTLTNPGPIGGVAFTPIIRHPEVAILGLGRAALQPVARGSIEKPEITARILLPLCLAFDHRVIDGAEAAEFTARLAGMLAEPEGLLLHV